MAPAFSNPITFCCDELLNSGSLLEAAYGSRVGRSRREIVNENRRALAEDGFYSICSVKRRFEALRVFSVFSLVRMHRPGRLSCLFSIDGRIPKLDVAKATSCNKQLNFYYLNHSALRPSFAPFTPKTHNHRVEQSGSRVHSESTRDHIRAIKPEAVLGKFFRVVGSKVSSNQTTVGFSDLDERPGADLLFSWWTARLIL